MQYVCCLSFSVFLLLQAREDITISPMELGAIAFAVLPALLAIGWLVQLASRFVSEKRCKVSRVRLQEDHLPKSQEQRNSVGQR